MLLFADLNRVMPRSKLTATHENSGDSSNVITSRQDSARLDTDTCSVTKIRFRHEQSARRPGQLAGRSRLSMCLPIESRWLRYLIRKKRRSR